MPHPRHTRLLAWAAGLLALVAAAGGQAADEKTPDTAPAEAGVPAVTSRDDAYREFRRLFDAKDYDAAEKMAQRVVDLTVQPPGSPDDDLQAALMNLATAQYYAGDYVAAESTYLRVIQLAEAGGRPFSTRLARATAGLASTYYAGKRYDLAAQRFEQALAMSRRNDGLLNEQQLPMLDKYADALTQLGRLQEALQVHQYALRIESRRHGEDDPAVVPRLVKFARWLALVGSYDASRSTLRRAMHIVETHDGPNSPQLIDPLTALADCDRRQLLDPSQQADASPDADRATLFHDAWTPMAYAPNAAAGEGEDALERAVRIATSQPKPVQAQVADVRTQLGDWYSIRSQADQALAQYALAWQAATGSSYQGKALTELLFGQPVLLDYQRPASWNRYANRPPDETLVRTVRIGLTVTEQGRVRDAKVVDDGGDAKLAEPTLRAASTARYRPRLVDGRPVVTQDVEFVQPWIVLAKEPPPQAPQAAKPEPTGK